MKAKSTLFLIETVIMTLIFALSAAVCLEIFAYSRTLSQESAALSQGSIIVQSAAESYKASGDLSKTAEWIGAKPESGGYCVFYDQSLRPIEGGDAAYILSLVDQGGDARIELERQSDQKNMLSLTVKAVAHE